MFEKKGSKKKKVKTRILHPEDRMRLEMLKSHLQKLEKRVGAIEKNDVSGFTKEEILKAITQTTIDFDVHKLERFLSVFTQVLNKK